jgi:hypothetical protein
MTESAARKGINLSMQFVETEADISLLCVIFGDDMILLGRLTTLNRPRREVWLTLGGG